MWEVNHARSIGLTIVDNHDEALRVAKSLKCADLILDPRVTSPDDAEILVDEITSPRNRGHGGCAATIVLPESQHAFSYACKITCKHGTIMTVSVVHIHPLAIVNIAIARMERQRFRSDFQRLTSCRYYRSTLPLKVRIVVCECEGCGRNVKRFGGYAVTSSETHLRA